MGQEIKCTARIGNKQREGKALLETSEIIFRPAGPDGKRLKIPFASMKSVKAAEGRLEIKTAEDVIAFELGASAEKWREKILHPKSRLEKLGVKDGQVISLDGEHDAEFVKELRKLEGEISETPRKDSDLIFLAAEEKSKLGSIKRLMGLIQKDGAVWVVYPKGQKQITEMDVLSAGRKAGLKDVKVVGFSPTHTALKFVVPLSKR
ncbi:MAG TPA: hypothetical protein VJP87_09235 [Candidatus Acidoferrales bacterium]|nr:hypothetical protein [Candidatus Acidoferrales bacterium]